MPTDGSENGPKDPILGLETPLMFAHRGGAGEVPESTKEAFRHAVKHGSNVLEVDVSLTSDDKIVVWHGPELKNVRGKNEADLEWNLIGDCRWEDLRDKAWVLHPKPNADNPPFKEASERRLLLLSEFFEFLDEQLPKGRTIPVNIELKEKSGDAEGWADNEHLENLLNMVDEQSKHRKIILASLDGELLKSLRKRMHKRGVCHPTSLAWREQAPYCWYMKLHSYSVGLRLRRLLVWKKKGSLAHRAFETSHVLLSEKLVSEVHDQRGSIYPFLTSFGRLASAIDDKGGIVHNGKPDDKHKKAYEALEDELSKLLEMGVDGVMTDYPEKVGYLIEKWRKKKKKETGNSK